MSAGQTLKRHLRSMLVRAGMRDPLDRDVQDADLVLGYDAWDDIDPVTAFGLTADTRPVRDYSWWKPPQKVVVTDASPQRLAWLQPVAPGVELMSIHFQQHKIPFEADAVMGWCTLDMVTGNSRLRWVQLDTVGIEMHPERNAELAARGILTCNLRNVSSPVVAEHAVALLLALSRRLADYRQRQWQRIWDPTYADLARMHVLDGRKALIVGLGSIGTRVAEILRGMGMQVSAVRNRMGDLPACVSHAGTLAQLQEFLADSDVVVSTLPQTPQTRNIFDAAAFSGMKSGALFINVGRGSSVVTEDLVAALQRGQLAGAGLDVVDSEPLVRNHPLWRMNNVILTPHVAARSLAVKQREWWVMRENLRRYVAGEPMLCVVDTLKGY
jgi:phosphoglycerate dehydrogenase-like enzyme